jgi:hypothetical protein
MITPAAPKDENTPVVRKNPDGSEITLFRYFSPSKLPDFLRGYLSLTPPRYLTNDPFEFAVGREAPDRSELSAMFDEFVRRDYADLSDSRRIEVSFNDFRQARNFVREGWIARVMSEDYKRGEPEAMQAGLSQLYGVICLSENPDNLLLWGHYTDSYKGFVAEFACFWDHTTFVPRARGTSFGPALQVQYEPKRPVISRDFSNAARCVCSKTEEWSYEREWRVVRLLATSEGGKTADGRCYAQFPPSSLRRIILGHQMTEMDNSEIARISKTNGFEHVRLQRTHPNLAENVVELRDID